MLLRDGLIEGSLVGTCIQVNGYEIARVTDGVIYRNNGANVDAAYHTPLAPSPTL